MTIWNRRSALLFGLLCAGLAAHAQGGPPFRTDDPDTPGNKHWEINIGFLGDRNPGGGSYQLPDLDINYGLGDRLQLKYELPLALAETRPQPAVATAPVQPGRVLAGLGQSQPGVKWRFYEHHLHEPWLRRTPKQDRVQSSAEPPVSNFSLSTYPQLTLNNPTRSVARGIVPSGPNFFLPIEFNARIGPIRINGDTGYNFGNHALAQSWTRGLLAGHEFTPNTEAYLEIYDIQDANRIDGAPKQRETTLGAGGRQALNHKKTLLLMLMGGRSFQTVSPASSQPSWIAYVGVQVLFGPQEPIEHQVEQVRPDLSR